MIGIAPDMARSRWVLLVSANPVVIDIPRREENSRPPRTLEEYVPALIFHIVLFFQRFKLPVDTVGLIVMLWEK